MNPRELLVDNDAFALSRAECEKIIDTQKRLPNFVFRRPFGKYFAIEYTQVHKKEFGVFLFELSKIHGDRTVNYMTIDPDPVNYYHRHRGFYGLASFKASDLVERYKPVMSCNGNADSFLARGGDVGTFWGSSLKWGIFCDRISWEMAIIAVAENIDVPTIGGFPCMNASEVADYIQSQYSEKLSVSANFIRGFLANYPC
jgi:hypothetical protein